MTNILTLARRIEKLEKETEHKKYLPVAFFDSEEEADEFLKQPNNRIGKDTIIFIDDFGEAE